MSRRAWQWTVARNLRRAAQLVALALFVGLFLWVRPRPAWEPDWTTQVFFSLDPLILLATALAAHALPLVLLPSLLIAALTVFFGRVFCGWFCPLGTIHAAAGWCCDRLGLRRLRHDHWSRWQRTKYFLLVGMLVMAAFGIHWVCIWDPLVLLYRTSTTALLPGVQWATEEGSTAVYQADPGVGPLRAKLATEPVYQFFRAHVFGVEKLAFLGAGWIWAFFLLTVVLNAYRRRFWCRYLCPLGALLGILAWRPWLRRSVRKESCNQCDLCGTRCHGAASGAPGDQWKASECFGCLNCLDCCPRHGVRILSAAPWHAEPRVAPVDLSKRALLASALGGLVGMCLLRSNPLARGPVFQVDRGTFFNAGLIRPPGALPEREFLQRCTACGMCMKVCTTGGLQPALSEAGLEGLWTPRLVPRLGQCDYNCTLCGEICPTGAIRPLTVEEKHQTRIGLASFDTTRCIPYAYGRDCIVCEEQCPVPDKAIYTVEVEARDRQGRPILDEEGRPKTIKQPRVDPEKCIGCGVCENKCVFRDAPAVRVRSTNESRHPQNQSVRPDDSLYG